AASIAPVPVGSVDGAPVLGYVFPTTLDPQDVGFSGIEGTVALAVTSHPDFDDTPLWDEDGNAHYDDDGIVYHPHWVVLTEDTDAPAGLAVPSAPEGSGLPPTAPMPMYLDSPGFTVIEDGASLRVLIPLDRVRRRTDFEVGALTALMRVDASGELPSLKVEHVLSALDDGNAVVPVESAASAPAAAWPTKSEDDGGLTLEDASGRYDAAVDTFVLSMNVSTIAATNIPDPTGQINGAPVLGYAFPTTISPSAVGFKNIEGTLALAVTSHPDFDDTPYWDESLDGEFGNDGSVYHVHWVVLVEDPASDAGLSVPSADPDALPPTAPMPMYLDSPGYHAFAAGDALHVLIPGWHLPTVEQFSFDALTARMRVDASGDRPVLRVEEVIDLLSGDLSLPLSVSRQ
ncbi:MAG: hypothetical protein KUG77_00585, partial [Nannocystaceae bacterium]|nr:hypothetical protein [Nannocystaceae bacterium]